MNLGQHLIACLAEEAGEVTQACGKILRFGMHDARDADADTNEVCLLKEVLDMLVVTDLLSEEGLLNTDIMSEKEVGAHMAAKRAKLKKYMKRSRELGVLE